MSNRDLEVCEMFNYVKFGFNREQGPYLEITGFIGCDIPEQVKPLVETFHTIWSQDCLGWVNDNIDKKGYALCFDSLWDGYLPIQQVGGFSVSLSGEAVISQLHVSEEAMVWGGCPSSELLISRVDEVANKVVVLSLVFVEKVEPYLKELGYE